MKIAIGNDHAGTDYKFAIIDYLQSCNIEVLITAQIQKVVWITPILSIRWQEM